MKNLQKLFFAAGLMIVAACLTLTSCTKEGPQGPTGPTGKDGTNGKDASETCKQCHAKAVVDAIATEFEMSKHNWGVTAFEEAGNTGCTPCHAQKAFIYVCENSTPVEFTQDATTKKWSNPYATNAANAIGAIGCFTCHSQLHTTYGTADLTLTNTAPVNMTMWGAPGKGKTIDFAQDGGKGNLCVKCHQPRPLTCGNDPAGRVLNYDSVAQFPAIVMYDSAAGVKNIYLRPSYRMHIHYGAVGAVVAGKGAIEFPGTFVYESSKHTTVASCQDCHMAGPMTGIAGGHSFNVRNAKESALSSSTTWNFNGCNVAGCHDGTAAAGPLDANSGLFKNTRTEVKTLLDQLATKINACGMGHDILHKDATTANLWAGVATGNQDGYLDIFSAGTNDAGYWRDPYNTSAPNMAKPKFPKLTNGQTGAIINFQFCLREYSLGIHNTKYVKALLNNSIAVLAAQGW